MKLTSVSAAALLVAFSVAPAAAQTCDCAATFASATSLISGNYAGFADKVTPATRDSLDRHTARLAGRASSIQSDLECLQLIQRWTAFFNDGHVGAGYAGSGGNATPAADEVRARFASWETVPLTEEQARRRLDENRGRLDPAEGIWEAVGTNYRLAVVRSGDGTGLTAVVLRADSVWWMPGQVKARLTPTGAGRYATRFYLRDHSEQPWTAAVRGNVMAFSGSATWLRVYPQSAGDYDAERFALTQNAAFRYRRLSDSTVVIHVPSMDASNRRTVDSLVQANRDEILRTPNLVIDLRGNSGGSDFVYAPLLPLMYTDTVRTPGVSFLSTPENIRNFEEIAADTSMPATSRAYTRSLAALMREKPGEFVTRGSGGVTAYDTVFPMPRRVAVLVDEGCASSCEQLVLAARQSRKVTLYGENTAGVLDYANVTGRATVCPAVTVRWATSRSNRLPHDPVDPHGISPHVRIPDDEVVPLDWVQRHLEGSR